VPLSRTDFYAGVKAGAPFLVGLVPFGMVVGVAAVDAGLSPLAAVGLSVIVFAGAAQLAAIELLGRNAPAAIAAVTALVVNLRMAMYSASIAPYFSRFKRVWRWPMAYLLVDQAYALSIVEFAENDGVNRRSFYLGTVLPAWALWQLTTALGAALGSGLPGRWRLEFAVPLVFLALLVPTITDRPSLVAAAVGGTSAVAAAGAPLNLGLFVGALAGITAGVTTEAVA
jgi:4-azaleucine resistance transporter AzlC